MGCNQSSLLPIDPIANIKDIAALNKKRTEVEIGSNQTASTSSSTATPSRFESYRSQIVDSMCKGQCSGSISKRDILKKSVPFGVSVNWLSQGFIKEVEEAGFSKSDDVSKIETVIRKKGVGLDVEEKEKTDDDIGPATIIFIYALENTVKEITETLGDYCLSNQLDTKFTYVWLSSLSQLKQDRAKDLRDEFLDHLKCVDHTVSLMSPWDKPACLSRARCIAQLHAASESDNCKLTIAMPPLERKKMMKSLDKIDKLYEIIPSAKIQSEKLCEDPDQSSILKLIEKGPGVKNFDKRVNKLLRKWLKGEIMKAVRDYESSFSQGGLSAFISRTGCGIMDVFQSGQVKDNDVSLQQVADLCSKVGAIMAKNGDNEEAIELFRKTLAIDKKTFREYHPDTAATLNNLGAMLEVKGDYNEALTYYTSALKIDLLFFGEFHADTATTRQNIATVYCDKGCYEDALKEYYKVLHIREKTVGTAHPEIIFTKSNIGSALYRKGDVNESLVEFEAAFALSEELLGKDHAYSKSLTKKINHVKELLNKSTCVWQIAVQDEWQIRGSFSSLSEDSKEKR